jgi:hypothetical protein
MNSVGCLDSELRTLGQKQRHINELMHGDHWQGIVCVTYRLFNDAIFSSSVWHRMARSSVNGLGNGAEERGG